MKIKEGFVLREVMGKYVLVAVGAAAKNFHGMVTLNETAADVWKMVEKGLSESEICDGLFEKYEVDRALLEKDVKTTLESFVANGFMTV